MTKTDKSADDLSEYLPETKTSYQASCDERIERAEYELLMRRSTDPLTQETSLLQSNEDASVGDVPTPDDFPLSPRDPDDPFTSFHPVPGASSNSHQSRSHESSRQEAYEADTLILFRKRLRLVCALTLVLLPILNSLHRHFIPSQYAPLLISYFCLSAICLATFFLANRLRTLRSLHILTLCSYALFCCKASMVISLASDSSPAFLMGSHTNIVLSLLLLPLTIWECLAIGAIALGTLAWTSWWILVPQESALYYSHLFVTTITVVWVLIIAHFQNATRRRAFNATFDLSHSAARLREMTFRDALTGAYNRRYLKSALDTEIARATRHGRPLSVVMFDLDNFKQVNDNRGHIVGDKVLCVVWAATMRSIRTIDTAARYGGDEFALVLPETDSETAQRIVARLRDCVAEELQSAFQQNFIESQVTLSIGIATALLARPMSSQQLLDLADQFLYQAKRSGKNKIAA